MGCIFGCDQYDDDDDGMRRRRSMNRISPLRNYCLLCHCEEYHQRYSGSNRCFCGHRPGEHHRFRKEF